MKPLSYILAFLLLAAPAIALGQSTEDKAKTAFSQCKYTDAAKLYELAAQMNESSNPTKAKSLKQKAQTAKRAATLRSQGDKAWNNKDYTTAESNYKSLLKLNSADATAKKRVAEIAKMAPATEKDKAKAPSEQKSQTDTDNNNAASSNEGDKGTSSVKEEQQKQLQQAMYWYGEKEYRLAKQCFEKAGSPSNWNKQQLDAFRITRDEVAYSDWYTLTKRSEKQSQGETFLTNFPNSSHAQEVKDYLFDSYVADNTSSSLSKAKNYAATTEQKNKLQAAQQKHDKEYAKMNRRDNFVSLFTWPADLPWEPSFGVGLEAAGLLQKGIELAIPIELRLFDNEHLFNMSVGVRLAAKGTLLGSEWISTLSDSICVKYHQISPYLNLKLHFNRDISRGSFFIAARGNVNINLGYVYSNYSVGSLLEFGTSTTKVANALNTISYTVGGEFGYGSEMTEFYVYYTYDLKPSVDLNYNGNSTVQTTLLNNDFRGYLERKGIFGAGVRLYLDQ